MRNFLKVVAAGAILSLSALANANEISVDVLIAPSFQPGSVQHVPFTVVVAGEFHIDAQGSPSLGAGFNHDPMMYLFIDDGALDSGDYLAYNDDYFGRESHLDIWLGVGNYILAVSEYAFSMSQAISGIEDSINSPNTYIRATIGSWTGTVTMNSYTAAVPEPGELALLGIGLVAIGFARRRKNKKN